MTVVAWDGKTLAADSAVTVGGMRLACEKIERFPDGSLYGAAGDGDETVKLADFIRKGGTGRRPKCESVYALHILPDGTVNLYSGSAWPDRITSPFVAIGSGCKYAMAVMWAGFDSARACEAAIALDKSCSAPVVTLQHSKQPPA